jgi:transposase
MNQQILFVGLDVDDKAFHGHAISEDRTTSVAFCCRPNIAALRKQLSLFEEKGFKIKVCYEATYIGFSLYRDLCALGFECAVIAPSLIPTLPGQLRKTDRLDSQKLADYYLNGLLTEVHVPNQEDEVIRDLIRTRKFISEQIKATKNHIVNLCRRMNINYRGMSKQNERASFWTKRFFEWLEAELKEKNPVLKFNLKLLLMQLRQLEEQRDRYDSEIESVAEHPRFKIKVEALCCYRGFKVLTAMSIILEIGDPNRFDHPRKLASYAGIDLREYSSGGKERRFSITKMGNKHLRTSVVEASQFATRPPSLSRSLKIRRQNANPKFIAIADRAMLRLNEKATRLRHRGKAINKIKVACARELLCFVWESLREAA